MSAIALPARMEYSCTAATCFLMKTSGDKMGISSVAQVIRCGNRPAEL